ncbi:dihydrolipoyllysine-residue acetyltransferase [Marinicellulosiphila megalodicopiae]|uniref:dihydrolipoyllysine-residue acetyltransferase n=1 Tax=Marinicellulosiphila megalodicopiae TaxID=2724896 RepID=UPI003BB027B1
MATEIIKVPNIGDIESAEIIEVSVKVGDVIAVDDTLIVVETDKASMEVPSPAAGKITAIKIKVGDEVSENDEIIYLEVEGSAAEVQAEPAQAAPSNTMTASASIAKDLFVPDIGTEDEVEVIEVCVKVGDIIEKDDSLVVLETDKASLEVPATEGGEVVAVKVNVGDQVKQGSVLVEVKTAGESAPVSAPTPSASAPAAPAPVATSQEITVTVPDIGTEGEVEVIEVSINVGDTIAKDDTVVTLETDKASMEVPSSESGEVLEVLVKVGDSVTLGSPLFKVKSTSAAPAPVAAPATPAPTASAPAAPAPVAASAAKATSTDVKTSGYVHAGPAVRRVAREFGVDLALIGKGTGPKARIIKEDVQAYVKKRLAQPAGGATSGAGIAAIPDQDFSKFGEVEVKKMARIQQLTAQNMTRNWLNIPHVTIFDEADVTDLEAFRKELRPEAEKRGSRLSALAFVVKAVAAGLQEFPQFNVSLMADGKQLVQKHYVHIGIAVATPTGLIVPVIRDADKKSIWEIADEIVDFAQRGRKGKVTADEMKGGCFTISSLGGIGSTAFTPIVNAPEVAILGLSNNQTKPFWDGKAFVPRNFLPLSLSFDHRAVNGADAGMFTTYLAKALKDLRRILL